jgi:hypothetical protein
VSDSNEKDEWFNEPTQHVLFHLNEQELNIYNPSQKETDYENYKDKNVLFIGHGALKRIVVLQTLKKYKLKRLVCLARAESWALPFFNDWIRAEEADLARKDDTLTAVENYTKLNNIKFDAIFTFNEDCTPMTSYLANHYQLASIPFDVCTRIKNKYEMRKMCRELQINTPKFLHIKSSERQAFVDAIRANHDQDLVAEDGEVLAFPVVAKNPIGAGKDFVKKSDDLYSLIKIVEESIRFSSSLDLLIEEYYEGHELDIEVFIQNNQLLFAGISDNWQPQAPFFFEEG